MKVTMAVGEHRSRWGSQVAAGCCPPRRCRRQQGRQVMGERWRAVVVWQTGGGRRRVGDVRKVAGSGLVAVLFLAWWWLSSVVGRVLGLGKSQREDGLKMNDDDGVKKKLSTAAAASSLGGDEAAEMAWQACGGDGLGARCGGR
ncbi:hypothetical protein Dimus_029164 [Dionaea muscipula]